MTDDETPGPEPMRPSTLAAARRVEAALRRAGLSRSQVKALFVGGEECASRVLDDLREALRPSDD